GHPFQVQLSRSLAGRGHEVRHLYARFFQTPRGRLSVADADPRTLSVEGLSISGTFTKYSYFQRRRQELPYGRVLVNAIKRYEPDVVIAANTPLDPLA